MMSEVTCDNVCKLEWRIFWSTIAASINISVAVLGLLLNSIGMFVLQKSKETLLFKKLLICLLAFDSGVLVTTIMGAVHSLEVRSVVLVYLFPYFIHPFFYICVECSICTTVVITYERYKALKDPIIYRNTNICPSHQKNMLKRHLGISIAVSCIYNIVRFFEYKVEYVPDHIYNIYLSQHQVILSPHPSIEHEGKDGKWNSIVQQQGLYHNSSFRTAIAITDSIVLGLLPLLSLIYFNITIYKTVKKERKIVSRIIEVPLNPKYPINKNSNGITNEDLKMAIVLMAIVGVFIFCYLFWLLHAIIYAIWSIRCNLHQVLKDDFCKVQDEGWYLFFDYGGRILITLNSSVNVLLYGTIRKNFRRKTKEVLSESWKTLTINLSFH